MVLELKDERGSQTPEARTKLTTTESFVFRPHHKCVALGHDLPRARVHSHPRSQRQVLQSSWNRPITGSSTRVRWRNFDPEGEVEVKNGCRERIGQFSLESAYTELE